MLVEENKKTIVWVSCEECTSERIERQETTEGRRSSGPGLGRLILFLLVLCHMSQDQLKFFLSMFALGSLYEKQVVERWKQTSICLWHTTEFMEYC